MKIENNNLHLPLIGDATTIKGKHVWLPQLVIEAAQRGEAVIENRTFIDCFIEGPAVLLAMGGCQFHGCNMGDAQGDARNLMLAPMGPQKVTGTVPFSNCTFQNCTFQRVGFTGPTEFTEQLIQMLGGVPQ